MLSIRELRLLTELARRADRIVAREELFELVWGRQMRPRDRSVDVYVRKLRVKLEAALPGWRFIHTHFGFGYRLAAEQPQANGRFTTRKNPRPGRRSLVFEQREQRRRIRHAQWRRLDAGGADLPAVGLEPEVPGPDDQL